MTIGGYNTYVANRVSNTVSVISTATNTVIKTLVVGKEPRALAVTPDKTKMYVVNSYGNSLSVVDLTTNRVVNTIAVGNQPYGMTISPDGTKGYVPNHFSRNKHITRSYSSIQRVYYYMDGAISNEEEWANMNIQDILPTWQW